MHHEINNFISPPDTESEDDKDDDDDDDESQFDFDQKDTILELYVSSYASQHQLLQCRRNTLVSDENKTDAKEMNDCKRSPCLLELKNGQTRKLGQLLWKMTIMLKMVQVVVPKRKRKGQAEAIPVR